MGADFVLGVFIARYEYSSRHLAVPKVKSNRRVSKFSHLIRHLMGKRSSGSKLWLN